MSLKQKPSTKSSASINIILIILVVLIGIIPFFIIKNSKSDFGGSDDKAVNIITQINSNYKPWAKPLWKPPGPEIESLLFALQAAIGAGFIGYFIGVSKARKENK